jgi:hypothetical protein
VPPFAALLLVLDFNIPWPDIWLRLSEWVKLFTFDIDFWFNIT